MPPGRLALLCLCALLLAACGNSGDDGDDGGAGPGHGTERGTGEPEARGESHVGHGTTAQAGDEAARLVGATRDGTTRFRDIGAAREAGFREAEGARFWDGGPAHFVSLRHALDGEPLDPERPDSLVYAPGGNPDGGGWTLIGAMYLAPRGEGPDVAGRDHWHAHEDLCYDGDTGSLVPRRDGACPPSSVPGGEVEMMHVWLFDHPGGPFAHGLTPEDLPEIRR